VAFQEITSPGSSGSLGSISGLSSIAKDKIGVEIKKSAMTNLVHEAEYIFENMAF
jgi:hypothetical protein